MRTPLIAALVTLATAPAAQAASTPQILASKTNQVPACVTPDHLMAFVTNRNKALPAKLREIAADYKRHGEELHVRWDYAFYQMLVETNYLKFLAPGGRRGDVSPGQNNFAGLGATGHRAPGESFASVDTGVLAHLQHVRLYSGDPVENPVAERTKLVTDLILPWAQGLKRPVTFTDLTHKWAPSGHSYADAIEGTADFYRKAYCTGKALDQAASADSAGDGSDEAASVASTAPAVKAKLAAGKLVKAATDTAPLPQATDSADATDTEGAPSKPADSTGLADATDAPDLAGPALKTQAKSIATASAAASKAADPDGDGVPDGAGEQATAAADAASQASDETTSKMPSTVKGKIAVVKSLAKPKTALAKVAKANLDLATAPNVDGDGQPNDDTAETGPDKAASTGKPDAAPKSAAVLAGATNQVVADAHADGGDGGAGEVTADDTAAAKTAASAVVKTALAAAAAGSKPGRKIKLAALAQPDATTATTQTETATESLGETTQLASLTVPANPAPSKNCKVFTASYGGGKSLLIQSMEGERTRFTALTVNEAKADSQAKAFINVYAKGGEKIAEFGTQNEALTKAFQLCPEG